MELNIDRGLKTYEIKDADGTPVGTIRFNPADPGLAGRWQELVDELDRLSTVDTTAMTAADTVALDRRIKERMDYALGGQVSGVLFGGMSCLALCEDGTLVFENVLRALTPVLEAAQQKAMEATRQRMAQHTKAYADPAAGLAPGQSAE